jgi:hypothetical protein
MAGVCNSVLWIVLFVVAGAFLLRICEGYNASSRQQFNGERHHDEEPWHGQEYRRQKRQFPDLEGSGFVDGSGGSVDFIDGCVSSGSRGCCLESGPCSVDTGSTTCSCSRYCYLYQGCCFDVEETCQALLFDTTTYRESVFEGEAAEICIRMWGSKNLTAEVHLFIYTYRSGTTDIVDSITISSGQRKCSTLVIQDDDILENDDYAYVFLRNNSTNVSGLYIDYRYFRVQILDDDSPAFAQSSYFVNETAGYVEICTVFTIDGDSALTVNATLNLPTLSGNATFGDDYSGERSTTFVISSPGGMKCINITIINDELIEGREVFIIQLSTSLERSTVRREARVYIEDDDILTLSLENAVYSADESDAAVEVCVVTLGGVANQTAYIILSTQSSTAVGGLDYISPVLDRNISTGGRECFSISILDDSIQEDVEQFIVFLDSPNPVRLETRVAIIEIVDDDEIVCTPPCVNGMCIFPGACQCSAGYGGLSCEFDVNECETGAHNCTRFGPARADCINEPGGFRCSCGEGYDLNSTTYNRCEDIDECDRGIHNCSLTGPTPAKCINVQGSFQCSCTDHPGYELNSETESCEDINECERRTDNCTGLAQCFNQPGNFYCSCENQLGYRLNLTTYANCEDIDECADGTHNCIMEGPAPAECINTPGSFICSCDQHLGYQLQNSRYEDIDECTEGISGCSQNCTNMMGSYTCSCNSGFSLLPDNRTCIDVNECDMNNGNCSQLCVNTPGSHQCECIQGFQLLQDGFTCEGIT